MNRVRMQSKFLAALLAILMVLSVVVALPAAAEETAAPVSAEKVLYSLDMSKAGALDATATAEWLAKNNGFAMTATNTNTIDADGFYKITKDGVVMSNGAPNDFFNLLAGWYPGYNTPGKTYEISMDLRLDKKAPYPRTSSSTGNFVYKAADGTEYGTLWTDESGYSFFAARVSGNYESLFRIGMVDGQMYLFAESGAYNVKANNYKTAGNVYVKDAKGNKIYVAEDGGELTGSNLDKFGLAFVINPETAYAIEVGGVYALRIVYELNKYATSSANGGETTVKAHLYVKGENDAEETYLGFSTWSSKANSAANGFRISDAAGVASFANVKVTVDEPATVVWSADLSKFGASSNGEATNSNVKSGYLNTVFAFAGSTLATSTPGGSAKLVGGLFNAGSNGTSIVANGTYSPFADLLTGNFTYKGQKLDATFIEFDYMLGTEFSYSGRSDAATVGGTSYTIVTDYAANGGGTYNLRFRSGGKNETQLFRVSPNGYLFTADLESAVTTTKTGVDGYLYYMDGETKVFFDANGYRYKLNGDEKIYIDDTSAAAPAVSDLSIGGSATPAKLDQAYKLTKGTTYRVGVKNVVESVSAGVSTIKQTVYIKAPGDTEWTLVGTSTQKWYDSTASGYAADLQIIWASGANNMMFGGNMVAYACVNGQHVEGYTTTETVLSDTGLLIERTSCSLCGRDEAKRNGVIYTPQKVTSTCETSYTLWTATDGSGKTFITDVTEGSHTYGSSDGVCTKCQEYRYMPGSKKREYTSFGIATGLENAPQYDNATGHLVAPNGGMALIKPKLDLNPRSPFVMTLEFKLTEAILNKESSNSSWPLLSYQASRDGGNVISEFVGVHEVDNKPVLMLGTYTDRPLKTLEYGEWYTLQIAVVPESRENIEYDDKNNPKNHQADARIYLDGEMLGEKYDFPFCPGTLVTGNVRVGIQTAGSHYRFGWEARYVDFQQTDLAGAYTLQNSNEVINIRYDRFQTGSPSHSSARANMGTTLSTFRPTAVVGDKVKYGILPSGYKTVSLSTLRANGEEFGLSGKKYEIGVKFAVPNTDANEDGKIDAIASGAQNLVRLSKYGESISSILLAYRSSEYSNKGQIYAKTHDLYDNTGAPITILREFDENGVPSEMLDLRVVVDEAKNTYSVYYNGEAAYYWLDDVFTAFVNVPMPLNGAGSTGKTTYGSITKADAVAANITGEYQYMRLFREIATVALEEVSVKLIPDSDVELVGTQVKAADFTTSGGFDLRFIFGLDDLYKESVQFDVKAYKNGQYVGSQSSEPVTTVFSAIKTGDDTKLYAYECTEGDYLTAVKVVGIDEATSSDIYTFEITAYLVGKGGKAISPRTYIVSCNGVGGNIRTVGK